MSWETYLRVWLEFNERAREENLEAEILREFTAACNCEPDWEPLRGAWYFEDGNLTSHVEGRHIAETLERWKDYIKSFSASVWYLGWPDEVIDYQEGEEPLIEIY